MPKNDRNKQGQTAANRGLTKVAPGMTGRTSEEYAEELGAGRTGATPLGAGAAGTARKGNVTNKKQK
ncbi:MAG TPA: hypothetical protein GXX28_10455 [Firmicutes bacterium]|nr:hypothetical protein [Bacillota bacterium]